MALIVAAGGRGPATAAMEATSKIPIVVVGGFDPVKIGMISDLKRPSGNVTGLSFIATELVGKQLNLLSMMGAQATTIAVLYDARQELGTELHHDILTTAQALGRQVIFLEARSHLDFAGAFLTILERRVGALLVYTSPLFTSNRDKLIALAARHKIPTIYADRQFTLEGGLMSYGTSLKDNFIQAGKFVEQILKGAKPVDLPFELATRYEFVINLKTAKTLNLEISPQSIAQADEVIR
jgi:putative tryptophan/tyrosine transport system substrate-binding protein